MDSTHEWMASTSPPRAQLFPRAANCRMEMEYSRPWGLSNNTTKGKFTLQNSGEEGSVPHLHSLHIPSTQAGARTSGLHIIQQSSSYQRQHTSPMTVRPASQPITSIYSPRDSHIQICNSASISEEHSSANLHSSVEHSFPSTISSHSTSSAQHTSSYELPSLQTLYKSHQQGSAQCSGKARSLVQTCYMSQDHVSCHRQQPRKQGEFQSCMGGEKSSVCCLLPNPVTSRQHTLSPYVHTQAFVSKHPDIHQQTLLTKSGVSNDISEQPPLATSSPSRQNTEVERVPFSSKDKYPASGKNEINDGCNREELMTYTRNHLLGAVERARNIALHRGNPLRHSAPELGYPSQKLVHIALSHPSNPEDTCLVSSSTFSQPTTIDKAPSDDTLCGLERGITIVNRSHSSITSGSSGRGSSAQGSKAASVTQSCGDSLQGELDFATVNPATTNNYFIRSNLHAEPVLSARHSPISSAIPIAETFHRIPYLTGDSSHSERSYPSPGPLDISVDENYEFDSISHLDSELLDRLQQYSHFPARPRPMLSNTSNGGNGERGLSDSELYLNLYPKPKKPSKYDNTEARCAALKEEFLRFRKRQQERRHSEELESEC